MPNEDRPRDSEIEEVSAQLNDALKSCRSVVATYKALLTPNQAPGDPLEANEGSEEGVPFVAPDGPAAEER